MKKYLLTLFAYIALSTSAMAQGWPSAYDGVMLQGFYWDSYSDSKWTVLESQADELSQYFSLLWIPQSGKATAGTSMGYDPLYWYNQTSSFGNETQLKSLIKALKDRGTGVIADVVINHRGNLSSWNDFPSEVNPYDGKTYQMTYKDICKNDEAASNGYQVGDNNDTGENWDGMRDLDHISTNVQENVKAYLFYLLNYLGYTGFRYDMVKGYSASYTGMYNSYSNPTFSVGECWDSSNTIKNWIEGTKVDGTPTSAAFDFQFRYTVRNAANSGSWNKLGQQNDGNYPLVSSNYNSGAYRRYAVTFVENHDTERRSNSEQDPLKKDTLAANAYLLAMPGTPCVFLKHWQAYKQELKAMIDARRMAGITNESTYLTMRSNSAYYANCIATDGDDRLMVVVGSDTNGYIPNENAWTEILSGYHYKYYLANTRETPWVDLPSGDYSGETVSVTLKAVSATDGAQLVYTTDGTEPTVSSKTATSGSTLTIANDCTLKVGLLVNGSVKNIISRQYTKTTEPDPDPVVTPTYVEGKVFAYFEKPADWGKNINVWAWQKDKGGEDYLGTGWPGVSATKLGVVENGNELWQWISTSDIVPDYIIFNDGGSQTADLAFKNGGYYNKSGLVTVISGIQNVTIDREPEDDRYYNLNGQQVRPNRKGIYIHNGKKYVK